MLGLGSAWERRGAIPCSMSLAGSIFAHTVGDDRFARQVVTTAVTIWERLTWVSAKGSGQG